MTIKESAEKKYSHLKHNQVVFEQMVRQHINEVTYYESLMRAAGYEWVKVDGEDGELVKDFITKVSERTSSVDKIRDINLRKGFKAGLAIGREQGRKEIKVEGSGYDAVSAEKSTLLQNNTCFYESDNTTAMNCKHCGKPKFYHNQ